MSEPSIASGRAIVVFGDSHTDALKRANALRGAPRNAQIRILRCSTVKNGKDLGDMSVEAAGSMLAASSSEAVFVSALGGNQHQVFGLVQHPVAFDFIEPGSSSELDSAQRHLIPYRALWATFEKGLRGKDGQRLTVLREKAGRQIYHLSPPPPKESAEHILKKYETAFVEAGLATKGVTPAPIRLKLWRLQCAVLKSLCAEWDIRLLPPPDDTQTTEGFLKPEYYANDATHANAAYGELVLRQLETTAASVAPVGGSASTGAP